MSTNKKVVEVRFDTELHDLSEEQVTGLLEAFDSNHQISVGLVYGGGAGVFVLDVDPAEAESLATDIADKSRELGLMVTLTEVLDTDEYNERALAEDLS